MWWFICGHGSSVGPIEENLYHYVMSRGIDKTSAEKLLIKGFFNEVISEDGWETISDKVSEEIMQKYLNVLERSKWAWIPLSFQNLKIHLLQIDINGTTVAVFKVDEDYYAIQNMCSHSEADLADGEVYDCKVECPLHGAEFDLKTGEALTLPATKPVTVFTTEVDGDSLVIKENLDA